MVIAADSAHLERAAGEKEKACARAEKTPSSGVACARASRAFGSSAAAGGLGVVAKVDDVKHVEEDHALEHDEKAEPVRAAVHAGELARAARMRERGPRAGKVAAQKRPAHPS